jgi:SAM-dependent methyltransferase
MAAQWFEKWFDSPYYHILYNDRDVAEAEEFVQKLVAHLQPAPGSRILDVGCGKGRHSIALAAMGFEVTGIDLSAASIEAARQSATDRLQFYVHDMRLPFHINYFHYAFNFFTSFGYFRTLREHEAAIRSIVQSLHPGGTLVLDYLNVATAENAGTETIEKEGILFRTEKWQDDLSLRKKITVIPPGGEPEVFTEQVARFTLADFTRMLEKNRLIITQTLGNYQLEPFDAATSPRLILVAQKQPS